MKKTLLAILLCGILIINLAGCGSDKQSVNTESTVSAVSSTADVTSSETDKKKSDDITADKKQPTESEQTETPPKEDREEKKQTEKNPTSATTSSAESKPQTTQTADKKVEQKPTETPKTETPTETEPDPKPTPISASEVEQKVAEYINAYRNAQGDSSATVLSGLTEVARYRAVEIQTDFSHNSKADACTVLKYGEYIDMTLFGGTAEDSYYRGYSKEAIGKGDLFGTADQVAERIATGFKNSKAHWSYVGDSQYKYIAVGIKFDEQQNKWYCCICVSTENYGG